MKENHSFFESSILGFIVNKSDPIKIAIQKIEANKSKIVFTVDNSYRLSGSLTDGDIRRWIVKAKKLDLMAPSSLIETPNPVSAHCNTDPSRLRVMFRKGIEAIPLVDDLGRVIRIIWKEKNSFTFGSRRISENSPTFLIAEIGNNHNGSLTLAKQLIEEAAKAGADCAKFQLRDLDSLYYGRDMQSEPGDLGQEYTEDLLTRFQLSWDETQIALDFVRECGMVPLCSPWDMISLSRLLDFGVSGLKIASADLTNNDLLVAAAKSGKPLFVSTGMSTNEEIKQASQILLDNYATFSLLHCNSTYPAPFSDIHLLYMDVLKELSLGPVGYSGHERGYEVCIAAVARGAKIIEKHFTLDRSMQGNDHRVSLLPSEFAAMTRCIRNVESSLGLASTPRNLSQGERLNREILAKSICANRNIKKGEKISRDMILFKSPGTGLQPSQLSKLLGRTLKRNINSGEPFFSSDINDGLTKSRLYKFRRPWGIPVRAHDVDRLIKDTEPDLLEFHLSYRDLKLKLTNNDQKYFKMNLIVHSPELFSKDHILDLASVNPSYRHLSIKYLQNVIDYTQTLKGWFPDTETPKIIVNVGGSSFNEFIKYENRKSYYSLVTDSLMKLNHTDVDIIIQTMPPFPWHFGGQRFHNLFVSPEECASFCSDTGFGLCLDLSHSALACNYNGWSISEFIKITGKYVSHLHICDAKGFNDEGLQILQGDIDFVKVAEYLDLYSPNVGFIPEIWQGHKNDGFGFWTALERLEEYF